MGAPIGNQNAVRAKIVTDALRKAAAQGNWSRLRNGCNAVMDAFERAEPWAVQYVSDRLDGRPAQSVEVDPNADGRLVISWISSPVAAHVLTVDAQAIDSTEKLALTNTDGAPQAEPPGAP